MINRLQIKGLFGRFDYDLDFDRPVTILTGPNGFGKSTVLRMIEGLRERNFAFFSETEYSKIIATFDNDTEARIIKASDGFTINEYKVESEREKYIRSRPASGGRVKQFLTPRGVEYRCVRENGEVVPFTRIDEGNERFNVDKETLYEWQSIKKACGNISTITDQRLMREKKYGERVEIVQTILELPLRLRSNISRYVLDYSTKSNELDSTYPFRLLKATDRISSDEFEKKLQEVKQKFHKLSKYKLLKNTNFEEIFDIEFNAQYATALKIYFSDFEEKYTNISLIIQKLELFETIVNDRLMFKKMVISKDDGFKILNETTGKPLALEQLSSGEKQVIVLYYDLIFNNNKNLLLLIDEPEISMHIVWQSQFIDDLIRIAEHSGFRAIVATHSPDIIDGKWDLQIDLGEQYQGNLYGEDEGEPDGN